MTTKRNPKRWRSLQKLEALGLNPMDPAAISAAVEEAQFQPPADEYPALLPAQKNGRITLSGQTEFTLDIGALDKVPGLTSLVLKDCHRFQLHGSESTLTIQEEQDEKRYIVLENCSKFEARDLCIDGGRNPLTLVSCHAFKLDRITVKTARGYGITLFHSTEGEVRNCTFVECLASGINIIGDCHRLHIHHCQIKSSQGCYNWDAGINVMHCSQFLSLEDVPDASHEGIDFANKLATPRVIWLEHCEIGGCLSQGIYLEGATQVLIDHCWIHDNNKEGLCLDWGSGYNHVRHCLITRNGERAHYNDEMCAIDFLPPEFRDSEGRHLCQLPGVSIDNGYGNWIEYNTISANYGGGVKIVRSGFRNRIRYNSLTGNQPHHSDVNTNNPYRVSEIKLLAMGTGRLEFDEADQYLDFLEPEENEIVGNRIASGRVDPDSIFLSWNLVAAKHGNTIEI